MGAVKALAQNGNAPKVYMIGRSRKSATPLLQELETLNSQATFIFIEAQVSLLKDVDRVCEEIKSKETKIDLLFLSAGTLSMAGRQETPEGLDIALAIVYFSRMRFTYNLLPLLSNSKLPRVVSILAAGGEGPIATNDLELYNNYSLQNEANHTATMTSLAMDELAAANPAVSFVHAYPGFVDTPLLGRMFDGLTGVWSIFGTLASWVLLPILKLFSVSAEEAGERALFLATSSRYAAPDAPDKGVELPPGVHAVRGEKGEDGELAYYRIGADGENAPDSASLDKYRKEGEGKKVWQHTLDVYDRISGRA